MPLSNRRRVTQDFQAKMVSSRRLERFAAGELLILVEALNTPEHSIFMRINGLRPNRGVECQYQIEPEELNLKTEVAR